METRTMELGFVTYEIQRAFGGERPAAELIREQLTKQLPNPTFDAKPPPVVK